MLIQRRDAGLSVLGCGGHRGHRRVRGHAAQLGRAARAVLGRLVGGRIGGDQGLAERAVDEHGAYSSMGPWFWQVGSTRVAPAAWGGDSMACSDDSAAERKSNRQNYRHSCATRMPSSAL